MFGYEGVVSINNIVCLATNASIAVQRVPIISNAVYGSSNSSNSSTPLQQPHLYDWENVTASVSFEVHEDILQTIKSLLLNRTTPIKLIVNTRKTGNKTLEKAYWDSINLSVSQDSALVATITFISLEPNNYNIGVFNDYFNNKNGLPEQCEIDALNQFQSNINPIPFWKTSIIGHENVKTWNFTVIQTLIKFMGCMNKQSNTAIEPYIIGFGTMTSDINIETYLPNSTLSNYNMWDIYQGLNITSNRKNLIINIDGNAYLTLQAELIQIGDPLSVNTSLDNLSWEYQVYKYT